MEKGDGFSRGILKGISLRKDRYVYRRGHLRCDMWLRALIPSSLAIIDILSEKNVFKSGPEHFDKFRK